MTDEKVTQDQLDELAASIKPVVRMIIGARADQDLLIRITCADLPDHPGVHVMQWEMKLDGEDLSPEQDAKVTELLRVANTATNALFPGTVQVPATPVKTIKA